MTHATAYRKFIRENPDVFDLFRRFAGEALEHGQRFSAKSLAERVRWETKRTWSRDRSGFKWNNNYTSTLARDLIREMPQLRGRLETRRVAA